MTSEMRLAEFIDFCLQRYQKQPSYRRTLDAERPNNPNKREAS